MIQVAEVLDLVIRYLKSAELNVVVETRYFCQEVVGKVQLFKIHEALETIYPGQPVRLYGDYLEVLKMRDVLV